MVSPVVAIDPAWQRPLTVDEYHRMIDAGILGEDEHVELLEGVMVDLGPKAAIYAEAGVAEYGVIDVERQVIHVHTGPDPIGRRYAEVRAVAPGATLICGALPALVVTVADLF